MKVVLNFLKITEDLIGVSKAIEIYQRYLPNFKDSIEYWLRYSNAVLRTDNRQLIGKVFSEFVNIFNLNLK